MLLKFRVPRCTLRCLPHASPPFAWSEKNMRDMSVFTSQQKKLKKSGGGSYGEVPGATPPSSALHPRFMICLASNPSPGYGTLSFVDDANLQRGCSQCG